MEELNEKGFINDILDYFVNDEDDVIDEIKDIVEYIAEEYRAYYK